MEQIDGLINAFLLDGKRGGQKLKWDDIRALNPEQGPAQVHLDFADLSVCRVVSCIDEPIHCRERLGGMLNCYYREAA